MYLHISVRDHYAKKDIYRQNFRQHRKFQDVLYFRLAVQGEQFQPMKSGLGESMVMRPHERLYTYVNTSVNLEIYSNNNLNKQTKSMQY